MSQLSQPDVELRLPAQGAYVVVLRATAAALAARLDFTLDDIDNLKAALNDAAALALDAGGPDLTVGFHLGEREITAVVGTSAPARPVDPESFAWLVLTSFADRAETTGGPDRFEITLTLRATPLEASR